MLISIMDILNGSFPAAFSFILVLFKQILHIIVTIQTRIVREVGKHVDHLTTTMSLQLHFL